MNMNWTGVGFYLFLVIFVMPAVLVAFSSKVRGYHKVGWTLTALLFSWLGFLIFLVAHGGRPAATRG